MDLFDSKSGRVEATFSIVIPIFNHLPMTIDCVTAVAETLPDGTDAQIILVNNCSTDGTAIWMTWLASMYVNPQSTPHPKKNITIEQIHLKKNYGFAGACNRGLEKATGDLVVFLNNDVVVTPGWLEEMCLPLLALPDVAFTAPMSNYSGGWQQIKAPYNSRNQMFDFARDNLLKNNRSATAVSMVTGLCVMARREVLEELKGYYAPEGQLFDETFFPGMWEDNDVCLRARLKSYRSMICHGAFVHHEGSQTISKLEITPLELFEKNQRKFQEKWAERFPKEHKIVAMVRVKDGIRHIERCLSLLEEWVDEIVVLDTGSTDGTIDVVRKHYLVQATDSQPGKVVMCDYETFKDKPLQEYKERQHLLEMAQGQNPTWIVRMDVDEVIDPKIKDRLPMLLNPVDPQILCWQFPMRTFWRGEEKYRVDGDWGKMWPTALFRNIPGDKLLDNGHPQGFHTPTVPIFQAGSIDAVNIPILHYGYSDYKEAERKYKFYRETDTLKQQAAIGGKGDYSHLVDETNLQLINHHKDDGISLLMLVKDEYEDASKLIESISTLVDEVIMVLTGDSEDRTGFKSRGCLAMGALPLSPITRICYFDWIDDFSAARNFGLSKCTRRWVLQLDPDEQVARQDLNRIATLTEREDQVAYLFNVINFYDDPAKTPKPRHSLQDAARLFRRIPELYYANPVHETLDDALKLLSENEKFKGISRPGRTDINITHRGYLKPQAEFNEKMYHYAELNRIWVEKCPKDPRPLYNLAMHHLDLDDVETAIDFLERARGMESEKRGLWQVNMALMGIFLREGKEHAKDTLRAMPAVHPYRESFEKLARILDENVSEVTHLIKEEEDAGQGDIQDPTSGGDRKAPEDDGKGGDRRDEARGQEVPEEHQPEGSHAGAAGGTGASVPPGGELSA